MAQKPSIPKGTRDFSPTEVTQRNFIFKTIRRSFELFGFQPIETPSFENSSTLMGKYGEEGDRLIFKILDSGDFFGKVKTNIETSYLLVNAIKKTLKRFIENLFKDNFFESDIEDIISKQEKIKNLVEIEFYSLLQNCLKEYNLDFLNQKVKEIFNDIFLNDNVLRDYIITLDSLDNNSKILGNKQTDIFAEEIIERFLTDKTKSKILKLRSNAISGKISEKALRYDLTVPFARYVVQHQNELEFPFKRYQMQPVWRADRPQKGRFREFYQCDADVVGSKSLFQEIEFIQLYDAIFTDLGIATTIKLNNRKILSGIAEIIGASDKLIDFTVALDKLDKIGEAGVVKEMLSKGIAESAIQKVRPLFSLRGTNQEKLQQLKAMLSDSDEGTQGVAELQFVLEQVTKLGLKSAELALDVTLARGLNYYTGAIFEVVANDVQLGSIGGGGRYDDLTGIFGLKDMSGIGISFGLDRIYLVLEELGLFEKVALPKPKVLFLNFGVEEAAYCLQAIKAFRESEIKTELYPDAKKIKKQLDYANKREIEFVVIVGSDELKNNTYTLKNMNSGEQSTYTLKELLETISNS